MINILQPSGCKHCVAKMHPVFVARQWRLIKLYNLYIKSTVQASCYAFWSSISRGGGGVSGGLCRHSPHGRSWVMGLKICILLFHNYFDATVMIFYNNLSTSTNVHSFSLLHPNHTHKKTMELINDNIALQTLPFDRFINLIYNIKRTIPVKTRQRKKKSKL